MLWPYALKEFSEELNKIKVDNDGITPMEKFSVTTKYITSKTTTHGAVQFMSCMKN